MDQLNNIMSIFWLVSGVCCLYAAIVGKGDSFYRNGYPKEAQESVLKMMRFAYLVSGLVLTASGVIEFFKLASQSVINISIVAAIVVSLGVWVWYMIAAKVKFGEKKEKQPKSNRK